MRGIYSGKIIQLMYDLRLVCYAYCSRCMLWYSSIYQYIFFIRRLYFHGA